MSRRARRALANDDALSRENGFLRAHAQGSIVESTEMKVTTESRRVDELVTTSVAPLAVFYARAHLTRHATPRLAHRPPRRRPRHARRAQARLALALHNDARFLADAHVLDYSLLVMVDERRGVVGVGVIDYLTAWTWERNIESRVKRSGLLGQRGKVPTIVEPAAYAQRFRTSMWAYFTYVPDKFVDVYIDRDEEAMKAAPRFNET